jgi:hypothetical protein
MSAPEPPVDDEYDEVADARGCYFEAIRAIGERVRAGEPVPEFLLSEKK